MHQPSTVVITGLMAAGKSALAQALAEGSFTGSIPPAVDRRPADQ